MLSISGETGDVVYSTDVQIKGSLTVNGRPITGISSGGGGGVLVNEILTAPYQLSSTPTGAIALFVNGQLQRSIDYTLSPSNNIVWKSQDFMLSPTDTVEAVYQTE